MATGSTSDMSSAAAATVQSYFSKELSVFKLIKESLAGKISTERRYLQYMDDYVRNGSESLTSGDFDEDLANVWSIYLSHVNDSCRSLTSNLDLAEEISTELQSIINIRENQRKMMELEYSAIGRCVHKDMKKHAQLKKDLNRLYETCTVGLDSVEKMKAKGKLSDKELSLLEHNFIRLHETHNACLLASLDVKHAQALASNTHLPAMNDVLHESFKFCLKAVFGLFKKLVSLRDFGLENSSNSSMEALRQLEAESRKRVPPHLRSNVPSDLHSSNLPVSPTIEKLDFRLADMNSEKFSIYSETIGSIDDAISQLESDIRSQRINEERLLASLETQNKEYESYLESDEKTFAGVFIRQCDILQLEAEKQRVVAICDSLSDRLSFIETAMNNIETPPSLIEKVLSPLLLTAPTSANSTSEDSKSSVPKEYASSLENNDPFAVKNSKLAKGKVQDFFKSFKQRFSHRNRHEILENVKNQNFYEESVKRSTNQNSADSANDNSEGEETFWSVQVRNLPYFHGILPRNDIDRLFHKNGNKNGDFLLRESWETHQTDEKCYRLKVLLLSVYWDEPHYYKMATQQSPKTSWRFGGPRDFATIAELIKYYLESGEEISSNLEVRLLRPIHRSSDFLQNDWIKLGNPIGEGAYGSVYQASYEPPGKPAQQVAVKVLKSQISTMSKSEKANFINEARQMQDFSHPNIISFIGVAATRDPMMLVMEFCIGGSLLSLLRKRKEDASLHAEDLYKFSLEAACGMEYLSRNHIIHRDLAARNCLIGKHDSLKISDFGLSRSTLVGRTNSDYLNENIYQPSVPTKIPIRWTSPETFMSNIYTTATDVWSFGILLWEIFSCGQLPWPNCRTNDISRDAIQSAQIHPKPDNMPETFYEKIMLKCLSYNADSRPSFAMIRVAIEHCTPEATIPGPSTRVIDLSNRDNSQIPQFQGYRSFNA